MVGVSGMVVVAVVEEISLKVKTVDGDRDGARRRLTEETFGLIYWANTIIGHASAISGCLTDADWASSFQRRLFVAGQDVDHGTARTAVKDVRWLRDWRCRHARDLPAMQGFILPGGSPAAARWQEAAAVLMQARRLFARLARELPIHGRLAEFLDEAAFACFVQARLINRETGNPEHPVVPSARLD